MAKNSSKKQNGGVVGAAPKSKSVSYPQMGKTPPSKLRKKSDVHRHFSGATKV